MPHFGHWAAVLCCMWGLAGSIHMWRATEEAIVCVPAPHTPDIKNVILSCYCFCSDTLITTFMEFHKRDSHGGRLHSCLATIGSVCLCFWSIQTDAYKMRPTVTKLSMHPHCQRQLALKAHKRFFTNHICLPFLQTIVSLCNKLNNAVSSLLEKTAGFSSRTSSTWKGHLTNFSPAF